MNHTSFMRGALLITSKQSSRTIQEPGCYHPKAKDKIGTYCRFCGRPLFVNRIVNRIRDLCRGNKQEELTDYNVFEDTPHAIYRDRWYAVESGKWFVIGTEFGHVRSADDPFHIDSIPPAETAQDLVDLAAALKEDGLTAEHFGFYIVPWYW